MFNVLIFLGGVGIFLYGIKIMGQGLESSAGDKLKVLLNKVTSKKITGVLVGLFVTAIIQSSSATTVMVVSLVNTGFLNLSQATCIIMGANIGTTVTSLLLTLNLSDAAPVFVFIGIVMIMFFKKELINNIGEIISGFGLLFVGMNMMSNSMTPLQNSPYFTNLIISVNNPFFGIIIGLVFTAIIQSSSASVGIIQALGAKGLLPIDFAVYILYGQNIGTVVTALLSTVGSNANSKRAAIIHLLFNAFGTFIFVILTLLTPFTGILKLISDKVEIQISAAHIIFNIVNTILLFPFSDKLVTISHKIIPSKRQNIYG